MKMLASFSGYSRNGLLVFVLSSKIVAFLARSVKRVGFSECPSEAEFPCDGTWGSVICQSANYINSSRKIL
jgi:hypothetical protein